jgi:hypothetical protein
MLAESIPGLLKTFTNAGSGECRRICEELGRCFCHLVFPSHRAGSHLVGVCLCVPHTYIHTHDPETVAWMDISTYSVVYIRGGSFSRKIESPNPTQLS